MRLQCFDLVANKFQKEADSKAKIELGAPKAQNKWDIYIEQSKIDDSTNVFVSTTSLEPVSARFNRNTQPRLTLRCLENKTAAVLIFDGMFMSDIQGYGEVTFRVDKKKAFVKKMQASTDNQALGLFSGGAAIPFIKTLFDGNTLLVKVTPYNESPVMFSFNIEGIEEALIPLRQACKW